jgi:hypothetical protein
MPPCQKIEKESLRPLLFKVNGYMPILTPLAWYRFLACLFLNIKKRCMKTNQRTKRTPKQTAKRTPETIEERVHRHISDINSKITDDDIKSVTTELDIRGSSTPAQENKANKKQKRNSAGDKGNNEKTDQEKRITPWDLLSEGI